MTTLGDFLDRVEQTREGCWEWTGSRHRQGYGQLGTGLAHREVYRITHGVPREDMGKIPAIRHRCDNPPCVNPLHLEAGTQGDNIEDYLRRGRERERRGNPASAKLTEEIVARMRREARAGKSITELAKGEKVSLSGAFQAVRGKTWKFVTEPPVHKNKPREL